MVGVVGDVRQYGLDRAPGMEVYVAQEQEILIEYYRLVARTTVPPLRLERAVREAFRAVDPMLPVYHVKSLEDYLAGTLATRTVTLALLGLFGALALMLAAVGIYGVISYTVELRTREVGIRMALGAERRDVLALGLRQGLLLVTAGLSIGLVASLFLTRLLTSLLFEVRLMDWGTSAAALTVLASMALAASYFPARRAASVDPMAALREE